MLLRTEGLTKRFGGFTAISEVDFTASRGDLLGIIGPNGSGKTTFFNVVSGVYAPSAGRVWFDGVEITGKPAHEIAGHGIARTFQMLRIFGDMTVLDNVLVGQHVHLGYGAMSAAFSSPHSRRVEREAREAAFELLEFVGLADFAEMPASDMSIGQRRLLALGRSIAMKPKMLMLDEPAAGLSPVNVDRLMETVVALRKRYDLTIVIIEHILKVIMDICSRVTVFDHGQRIAEGSPATVRDDPQVIEAYLGKQMDDDEIRRVFQG